MSNSNIDSSFFDDYGLNSQAVFNIDDLPEYIITDLLQNNINISSYRQLIVIGSLGKSLWHHVQTKIGLSENPIDEHSLATVRKYFATSDNSLKYRIIYPGSQITNLQELGILAGWHYDSPFKVGINHCWGSWFAYRAVVLTNTKLKTTDKANFYSPCLKCAAKPCIQQCPAGALGDDGMKLRSCIDYRKKSRSLCKTTCLSPVACPVGSEFRYSDEQIHYHYSVSMNAIKSLY